MEIDGSYLGRRKRGIFPAENSTARLLCGSFSFVVPVHTCVGGLEL